MNTLPPFTPIGELFPDWIDAYDIISQHIRQRVEFVLGPVNHNVVQLDFEWLSRLHFCHGLSPLTKERLIERINLVHGSIVGSINMGQFERFLGRPLTKETVHHMNAILQRQQDERRLLYLPTIDDISHHLFGIRPSYHAPINSKAEVKMWPTIH